MIKRKQGRIKTIKNPVVVTIDEEVRSDLNKYKYVLGLSDISATIKKLIELAKKVEPKLR